MNTLQKATFIILLLLGFNYSSGFAANELNQVKPIKFQLNDKGTSWSKISLTTQFWTRYTQLNQGTTNASGIPINSDFDWTIRRSRISVYNNINNKIILYTQLGFNNISPATSSASIYFHDFWTMFNLRPKTFSIGGGLHGWNGISRLTNTSYQSILSLDNPGFNIPTINQTDRAGRQLGIFVKGTISHLSYRFAANKPYNYDNQPETPQASSSYKIVSNNLNYKGYVAFNFLDEEVFNSPFVKMTYLGEKRICNLGLGFDYLANSVLEYDANSISTKKDRILSGVDFMLELPFSKKQAITFYSVFYDLRFGKNYLRKSGTMNHWTGGTALEGAGNKEFKIGTGNIWYTTVGYLLPEKTFGCDGRIQLFGTFTQKKFEAISTKLYNYDGGIHYYAAGQKLKYSFQISNRPVINDQTTNITNRLNTFIFQLQISI